MKKSFTLIELLVAVSILSVGLVFVLRSFLGVFGALEISSNRIQAVNVLSDKLIEQEAHLREFGRLNEADISQETAIGIRPAALTLRLAPTFEEEPLNQTEANKTDNDNAFVLYEAKAGLSWEQGGRKENSAVVTYFLSKEDKR